MGPIIYFVIVAAVAAMGTWPWFASVWALALFMVAVKVAKDVITQGKGS